jgi:hypothetical protein
MVALSAGRKGRPYRTARERMFREHGDVCVICGHPGSTDAHHVPARQVLIKRGLNPDDPRYMRPAHGVAGCPVCPWINGKPRRCNQIQGTKAPQRRPTQRW